MLDITLDVKHALPMRNKVRELREDLGLTQEALGQKLDVSRQSVNSIETGRYKPSLELALKIARLFELQVEEVFFVDDAQHADADQ